MTFFLRRCQSSRTSRNICWSTSCLCSGGVFNICYRNHHLRFYLTAAVAVALRLVPYEYIGRNRVPAIVFKGLPSTFHGFVISIMFAFSGAFSALLVPNNPKILRLPVFLHGIDGIGRCVSHLRDFFTNSLDAKEGDEELAWKTKGEND
ncbi:unnamed protein product [Camellia sinensis]